jgi:hypothetical protein
VIELFPAKWRDEGLSLSGSVQPSIVILVMHVITTFVELSNLFPHLSMIHGIFTTYFTYLTNFSQFHISCIQKTDNRLYFTVSRALDRIYWYIHICIYFIVYSIYVEYIIFNIFVPDWCDIAHFNLNICKLFLDMLHISSITCL